MKRMGFTEEQIEEIQARQRELLDPDEDDEEDEEDFDFPVWPENWDASQIFLRLQLQQQVDQGLTIYTGVPPEQIEHWAELMGIPADRYLEVSDSVMVMVRAACRELNRRNAEAMRRQLDNERARSGRRKRR